MPQPREGAAPLPGAPGVPAARPADAPAGLVDRYGRRATDMRLSLTDKCNLRCTYCMPAEGLEWLSKQAVMSAAEIVRIVRVGVELLGVRELRLTGGEPLVRADLIDIIAALRKAHPGLPISMTTNGVGLDKKAAALKAAGLTRINVSLDSLHEETFTKLTRRPFLDRVLAGVDAAWAAGLGPVKLNAVLMRGINDAESPSLLAWALDRGYELRFIEQMPLDADHGWTRRNMITAAEIRDLLSADYVLSRDPRARDGAPAERFEVRRRAAGSAASAERKPRAGNSGNHRLGHRAVLLGLPPDPHHRRGQDHELPVLPRGIRPARIAPGGRQRPGTGGTLAGRHVAQAQGPRHGPRGTRRPGLRPAGPQHERHRRLNP